MLEIDDDVSDVATPPPNQAALAGPSKAQRVEPTTAWKRKADKPAGPAFKRQALGILPEERHDETTLTLSGGKKVRGFDFTAL